MYLAGIRGKSRPWLFYGVEEKTFTHKILSEQILLNYCKYMNCMDYHTAMEASSYMGISSITMEPVSQEA